MDEVIKQSWLNDEKKIKLEEYYGKLPDFYLYRLNSIEDFCKIDRKNFVQHMINGYMDNPEKNISFYHRYRGKNYIVLINDEDIFHEISHLMFKDQLDKIFPKKQWRIRDFLDEIIAECNSTRILGKSKFFPEIKRERNISNKKNLSYHIGVAFARYNNLGEKPYEKYLKAIVDKMKLNIKFNENRILEISKEAIISMFK